MHQYHHRLLFKVARDLTGLLHLTPRGPVRRLPLTAEIRKFANRGRLGAFVISVLVKHHLRLLGKFIRLCVSFIQVQSNIFATERRATQFLSGIFHVIALIKCTQRHQRRYEKLAKSVKRKKETREREKDSMFALSTSLKI